MLELKTDSLTNDAGRLLRASAYLTRWRPVHLHRVIRDLRYYFRQGKLLGMVEEFFPETLPEFEAGWGWLDTLSDFLKLVEEAGWFAIDWKTLDYLWECYAQLGDDDCEDCIESDYLMAFSHFVEHMPVRHYNYDEDEWLNEILENVPLLALVRGLVDPRYQANISEWLIEYELYDVVSQDIDLLSLPERCEGQPEPLCHLSLLVKYVRRETGNRLLNTAVSLVDWDFSMWRWDSPADRAEVKRLSAEAQPEWQKIEALLEWADGPEQVEEAVCLLFR